MWRQLTNSLLTAVLSLAVFASCSDSVVTFDADTESNLRNPYMGWALYSDGHMEVDNADEYWAVQDEASKYANVFYLRWRWSDLEPEEGRYAWIYDENFKSLIQGALDRGLRLAFRVYVNGQDNLRPGTPQYVLEGAKTYRVDPGHQTPYADDPFFVEKYTKFIEAFGKEFNDPSKVDYVDSYGLGWWGEEAHMKYADKSRRNEAHDRIVKAYEKAFDKVINVVNQGYRDAHEENTIYNELKFSTRRDGYASMWFTPSEQVKFMSHFPQTPLIAEACYWKDVDIADIEDGQWQTWGDYYREVVDLALKTHANYLDLRTTVEAPRYLREAKDAVLKFISLGGYRILPVEIRCREKDGRLYIDHSWRNVGVGVLPNNNVHLRNKYKVMFGLFDNDNNLVKRFASDGIEVSELVGDAVLTAKDTMNLNDLPIGKYKLAVGIVNTIENDSKDIRLAVKNAKRIKGEWVYVKSINNDCPMTVTPSEEDLQFDGLASTWDRAIPLGNATVGALVWQNGDRLRFSLDRVDLWDLRPSDSLSGPNYNFEWIKEHIRKGDYLPVQQKFDYPYDNLLAPSKIHGAALEFISDDLDTATDVRLYLNNALCRVKWASGAELQTFVQADRPIGWFVFSNLESDIEPVVIAPRYSGKTEDGFEYPADGQDLSRLGYEQGEVTVSENSVKYHQPGYGGFYYDVDIKWQRRDDKLYGVWSVSSSLGRESADKETRSAMSRGVRKDYEAHIEYWKEYWRQSSVSLPDPVLQKQYQNEMYKFASASREDSYPISLQAVWTADNGKLPPWKGDYHHDLNTQLSYWPAFIGNHLKECGGYLNTLWKQMDTYRNYTKEFFDADGINVPGVATLDGKAMGGWAQYAMSQTISAWLSQYFYLYWKYSADKSFLKTRAYPFVKEAATFLEQISFVDNDGVRRLEFTSSPEIFDNSINAWFSDMTNYDLSLMRFAFHAAAEMAGALDLPDESAHWTELGLQLPDYALDEEGALCFAKGCPYQESHRHFSNAMAFHPLGLIDYSQGEKSRRIIDATVEKLEKVGPQYWCGYSYSWLANMYARMFDGDKAARTLDIFATCFCSENTFHLNGDQTGTGKSSFTYRPFTLEGNFAFASAVQEMLLQSHSGVIRIFPAIPSDWENVSFENLRAMGAFLVSAKMEDGAIVSLSVKSEKGGDAAILLPGQSEPSNYHFAKGQTIRII